MRIPAATSTDEQAGQANTARHEAPSNFVIFYRFIREFEDWLATHEDLGAHRLELQHRLKKMQKLWDPYMQLLIDLADPRNVELTNDFNDAFFAVIARAKEALKMIT